MAGGDETGLWAFMLAIHARPGVAPACLLLQDEHGLDIPLFLAVLYGAGRGKALSDEAIRALDAACADWRREVVQPLRRLRRTLKAPEWLDRHPQVPALREVIKAQELWTERIEADMLAARIATLADCPAPDRERAMRKAAAHVLALYAPGQDQVFPEAADLIVASCAHHFRSPPFLQAPGHTD